MIGLVLILQIVSLVFFFKIILLASEFSATGDFVLEKWLWYLIVGLNTFLILRFFYIQIYYSYGWQGQLMELFSFGISLLIVIPSLIYYLIKRNRK